MIIPSPYLDRLKYLNILKHEIKKKRILFDESKKFFGFDTMTQLIKVKNTSEIKGYPFLIYDNLYRFGLKVIPVENKYEKSEHPSHLEFIILRYLTENMVNKKISPHFVHFLGQFKVSNKVRALKHLNLKRLEVENQIRTHSNVVISEFVEGKSLDNWLHDTYEADKQISKEQWKIIVFQLIYTIHVMQAYYKLMHNDFHYGNILMDNTIKEGGYYVYKINKKVYYIPNTGILPKLFDFEYAMVYSNKIEDTYPNKFIVGHCVYDKKTHTSTPNSDSDYEDDNNVPCNFNRVYDLHYFLTSLLELFISEELFNWVIRMYPDEVIPPDDSTTTTCSNSNSSDSSDSSDSSKNSTKSDGITDKMKNLKISSKSSLTGSNSNTVDSSSSDTSDSTSSSNDSSSKSSIDKSEYLKDGRLINGTETKFKLPVPLELLENEFFNEFLIKPYDFNEATAIYFTCEK